MRPPASLAQGNLLSDLDKALDKALPILQQQPAREHKRDDWDTVQPGEDMPFAWDTPPSSASAKQGKGYRVLVRAYVRGSVPPGDDEKAPPREIRMDDLQVGGGCGGQMAGGGGGADPGGCALCRPVSCCVALCSALWCRAVLRMPSCRSSSGKSSRCIPLNGLLAC